MIHTYYKGIGLSIFSLCFVLANLTPALAETSPNLQAFSDVGPYDISVRYDTWVDANRERTIPVKIYKPRADEKFPVVLFSHGLGGGRDAAEYLGSRLASWGFLAVHMQHPGSDYNIWIGKRGREAMAALRDSVKDPQTSIQRFMDPLFVLDEIERLSSDGMLPADMSAVAIMGHSFGAHSTLAALGRIYPTARGDISFKDERIKAGVALSPPSPGPNLDDGEIDRLYAFIDRPILHITGTEDRNPIDPSQSPSDRIIPFRSIDGAPQYLIVFDGGDHGVFSGRMVQLDGSPAPGWYSEVQQLVMQAVTAFLMAELKNDEDAQHFMDGNGFVSAFQHAADIQRRGERIERDDE